MAEDVLIARVIERIIITTCVPLLIVIGYRLFEMGATGKISISANSTRIRGKAANLAPGAFCFLLGVVLAGIVMFRPAKFEPYGGGTVVKGYMGGTTSNSLFDDLVYRVAEFHLCVEETNKRDQCWDDAKLTRLPRRTDLKALAALEERARRHEAEAAPAIDSMRLALTRQE